MRSGSPGERVLRALEAFLVRGRRRDHPVARDGGLPINAPTLGAAGGVCPEWVDLATFDAPPDPERIPQEIAHALEEIRRLKATGRFVFGYVGALRSGEPHPDVVIRAAVIAGAVVAGTGRRIHLVIGVWPCEIRSRAALQRPPIERYDSVPPVPRNVVPQLLRAP